MKLSRKLFRANHDDKANIETICTAFENNARMRSLLGKNTNKLSTGIRVIVTYAYLITKRLGGVFICSQCSTHLLYYRKYTFRQSVGDRLRYIYMALMIIGPRRLKQAYFNERKVKQIRNRETRKNRHDDYLYVWFLAKNSEDLSIKGLVEVKEFIIRQAKELNIPIYMETTDQRLVAIYERVGFKFYNMLENSKAEMQVWFGCYCPTF